MIVADSIAGLTIYERGVRDKKAATPSAETALPLPLLLGEDVQTTPYMPPRDIPIPDEQHAFIVTSTADSGEGTRPHEQTVQTGRAVQSRVNEP